MEKTIYIPGDLVMTNGIPIGTKKGIVYQVTESNADKYTKVNDEFLVCVSLEMNNLASVSFVHELQHLLYGLKINSEMEI